jgi:hypothetical protein
MDKDVARMRRWEMCSKLVGKHAGRRPFGRPRHRGDSKEIIRDGIEWINLAEDMDLRVL